MRMILIVFLLVAVILAGLYFYAVAPQPACDPSTGENCVLGYPVKAK